MLTISGYEPTLLRISDKLSLRYVRLGEGPALVLLHTIRTQLEYFRTWRRSSQRNTPFMPLTFPGTAGLRSIPPRRSTSLICEAAS